MANTLRVSVLGRHVLHDKEPDLRVTTLGRHVLHDKEPDLRVTTLGMHILSVYQLHQLHDGGPKGRRYYVDREEP